jgi:hypothetical protein
VKGKIMQVTATFFGFSPAHHQLRLNLKKKTGQHSLLTG